MNIISEEYRLHVSLDRIPEVVHKLTGLIIPKEKSYDHEYNHRKVRLTLSILANEQGNYIRIINGESKWSLRFWNLRRKLNKFSAECISQSVENIDIEGPEHTFKFDTIDERISELAKQRFVYTGQPTIKESYDALMQPKNKPVASSELERLS